MNGKRGGATTIYNYHSLKAIETELEILRLSEKYFWSKIHSIFVTKKESEMWFTAYELAHYKIRNLNKQRDELLNKLPMCNDRNRKVEDEL